MGFELGGKTEILIADFFFSQNNSLSIFLTPTKHSLFVTNFITIQQCANALPFQSNSTCSLFSATPNHHCNCHNLSSFPHFTSTSMPSLPYFKTPPPLVLKCDLKYFLGAIRLPSHHSYTISFHQKYCYRPSHQCQHCTTNSTTKLH